MTPRETAPEDQITAALADLRAARVDYDRLHAEADRARRSETDAVNRMNAAQKAFDAAVEAVRKDAPWNSVWHQQTRRGERHVE